MNRQPSMVDLPSIRLIQRGSKQLLFGREREKAFFENIYTNELMKGRVLILAISERQKPFIIMYRS